MKLLQESPVEFLAPLSKPPETFYVAEATGAIGSVILAGTSRGIVLVRLDVPIDEVEKEIRATWGADIIRDDGPFLRTIEDMKAYLNGEHVHIKAVIQPFMIQSFTLRVHQYLTCIPYGCTKAYGEIAAALGKPNAARAVGGACGRNRVLIIIPCHRVLASNGLGGFGAGLEMKERLLRHEGIR